MNLRTLLFLTSILFSGTAFAQVTVSATGQVTRYNDQTSITGRSTNGDTYRCTQPIPALSGDSICTYNDGMGPSPGGYSLDVGVLRLHYDWTNPNNIAATPIYTLGELGGSTQTNTSNWNDGLTWKSGGIYYNPTNNLTYLFIHRQCDIPSACGSLTAWGSEQGTILVSPDIYTGTTSPHWCNPATVASNGGSCNASVWDNGGDAPNGPVPTTSTMFPGLNHAGKLQFVMFSSGDTTDNSSIYGYAISNGGDGIGTYLYRFPWASVQNVTTWNYYTGPVGGEYLSSANWCSGSESTCEPSQTNLGINTNFPVMTHLPSPWNSYLVGGFGNSSDLQIYSAAGITGPFTMLLDITPSVPQDFVSLLLSSLTTTGPVNGVGEIALISGGQYTDAPSDYSMYFTQLSLDIGTNGPFFNLPSRTIPGIINASNYDNGGQGVAFSNPAPQNQVVSYRPYEGVDMQPCSDSSNCFDVGWINSGEWINYTAIFTQAGNYNVTARVASAQTGGTFHLEIGGQYVAGPFYAPNTGGWDAWTSITVPLNYSMTTTGNVTVKFVVDQGGFNFESLQFTPSTSFNLPTRTIPGTISANNYDNGGQGVGFSNPASQNQVVSYRPYEGVDMQSCSDSSNCFDVDWINSGEWINYTATSTQAGSYNVTARVASGQTGGAFHLEIGGQYVAGPFYVSNTGGWGTWTSITIPLSYSMPSSGNVTVRLVVDQGGFNFESLQFTPSASSQPPVTPPPVIPAPVAPTNPNANTITLQSNPNLCFEVSQQGTAGGTPVILANCDGTAGEQFTYIQSTGQMKAYAGTGNEVCLDDRGAQGLAGDALQIWPCSGAVDQQWNYNSATGQITGINNLCMDLRGLSSAVGTQVQLWSCSGNWNQQFAMANPASVTQPPVIPAPVIPTNPNTHSITLQSNSNLCFEVSQQGTAGGTPVILDNCNGSAGQQFNYNQSTGQMKAYAGTGNEVCLDDRGAQGLAGDALQIWPCSGAVNQQWNYNSATGQIVGVNNLCMDLRGESSAVGTQVQLWSCSGNWNQAFSLSP